MKIARFIHEGSDKYGTVQDDGQVREISGSIYEPLKYTGNTYTLGEINLLPPCEPSKVICVGLNYKAHIEEFKRDRSGLPEEPVLFLKPPTAVIGPQAGIIYPQMSLQVDYEAELAVVVGKKVKGIKPSEVDEAILGYTCANDVTARDLQKKDGQWIRAKGFDTFLPLGPWIETEINPDALKIRLYLNGEIKQESTTGNMIFSIHRLISFISQVMTLMPGDVVLTGTPEGVGPMNRGDNIKVVIEEIGTLENTVV